jgi:hypothetical protein
MKGADIDVLEHPQLNKFIIIDVGLSGKSSLQMRYVPVMQKSILRYCMAGSIPFLENNF